MIGGLILSLFICSRAHALDADTQAESNRNSTAIIKVATDFYNNAWNFCGTKPRIVIYGHSIANGIQPTTLATRDAYRPAMLWHLAELGGFYKFAGSISVVPTGGSLICSPYTEGVSGYTVQQAYARLLANLATTLPNPTSADWVMFGPAATNFLTTTVQQTQDTFYAAITATATIAPTVNIGIVTDTPRFDSYKDTFAPYLAAIETAYNLGKANGYNVKFIDCHSCLQQADMLPDNVHVSDAGNTVLGRCWADLMWNAQ